MTVDLAMPDKGEARGSRGLPLLAGALLVFWAIVATIGPALAPHLDSAIVSDKVFAAPGQVGLLGSDYFGRDLLSRLIYGARTTLSLALAANTIAFLGGVSVGFVAAVTGRWIDEALSRVVDVFFSIPSLILALICISALGTSAWILVLTVGFIEATRVFRIARSVAFNILSQDFVDVARARGETMGWILTREVLPNALPPLLTDFGVRFTATIILMSSISFLGLGVQPPQADLGMMVRENMSGLRIGAMSAVLPALAILSITLATNLLVDWNLRRTQRDVSEELLR
jgi:peptide/nickel transport system permease protein